MPFEIVATATAESSLAVLQLVAPAAGTVTVKQGDTAHVWITSSSFLGVPTYLVQDILGNLGAQIGATLNDTVNSTSLAMFRYENLAAGDRTFTASVGLLRANVGIHVVVMRWMERDAYADSDMGVMDSPTTKQDALRSADTSVAGRGVLLGLAYDTDGANTPMTGSGFTSLATMWGFGGTPRARSQYAPVYECAADDARFTASVNERHMVGMAMYRESTQVLAGAGCGS